MSHGRNDEPARVLEADKPAIEQVVNARRKKKAVLPVEPLFIRRIPPRLAMAGNQVGRVVNPGDAAALLNLTYPFLEEPLSAPRPDESFAIGGNDCRIARNLLLQPRFPHIQIVGRHRQDVARCLRDDLSLIAYEADQGVRHILWHFREVDGLNAIPVVLQRAIFCGQEGTQEIDMFLWPDPVHELAEAHRDLPADILPVLARIAELKGLWTFPAIGLSDADGANEGVLEGEDDVSRRHLPHGFVEGVPVSVGVALG